MPTRSVYVLLGIVGIGSTGLAVSTQVPDVRPRTDAMLMKPEAGDWLSFR